MNGWSLGTRRAPNSGLFGKYLLTSAYYNQCLVLPWQASLVRAILNSRVGFVKYKGHRLRGFIIQIDRLLETFKLQAPSSSTKKGDSKFEYSTMIVSGVPAAYNYSIISTSTEDYSPAGSMEHSRLILETLVSNLITLTVRD